MGKTFTLEQTLRDHSHMYIFPDIPLLLQSSYPWDEMVDAHDERLDHSKAFPSAGSGINYTLVSDIIKIFHEYHRNSQVR